LRTVTDKFSTFRSRSNRSHSAHPTQNTGSQPFSAMSGKDYQSIDSKADAYKMSYVEKPRMDSNAPSPGHNSPQQWEIYQRRSVEVLSDAMPHDAPPEWPLQPQRPALPFDSQRPNQLQGNAGSQLYTHWANSSASNPGLTHATITLTPESSARPSNDIFRNKVNHPIRHQEPLHKTASPNHVSTSAPPQGPDTKLIWPLEEPQQHSPSKKSKPRNRAEQHYRIEIGRNPLAKASTEEDRLRRPVAGESRATSMTDA